MAKRHEPDAVEEATAIIREFEQKIAEALHKLKPKLVKAIERRNAKR